MTLRVIGAGLGRTGTKSLQLALNQLGFGPCYHMGELALIPARNVPLWAAALDGRPDWDAIFEGYASAVDWPTATFYRELYSVYPQAKFILTVRSGEIWVQSFSETIYKLHARADQMPAALKPWFDMVNGVVFKTGFPFGLDNAGLAKAFDAHTSAVVAAIPADRLLTYDVKDGWSPLCAFFGSRNPPKLFRARIPGRNSGTRSWPPRRNGKTPEPALTPRGVPLSHDRHRDRVPIFPVDKSGVACDAFPYKTEPLVKRNRPRIVGMHVQFDANEIGLERLFQSRVEKPRAKAGASPRWNNPHAEGSTMRMGGEIMASDIAPADDLAFRQSDELRVAAFDVAQHEFARLRQWRRFEKREIFSLARDNIKRAMKTLDIFGRDGRNRRVQSLWRRHEADYGANDRCRLPATCRILALIRSL